MLSVFFWIRVHTFNCVHCMCTKQNCRYSLSNAFKQLTIILDGTSLNIWSGLIHAPKLVYTYISISTLSWKVSCCSDLWKVVNRSITEYCKYLHLPSHLQHGYLPLHMMFDWGNIMGPSLDEELLSLTSTYTAVQFPLLVSLTYVWQKRGRVTSAHYLVSHPSLCKD